MLRSFARRFRWTTSPIQQRAASSSTGNEPLPYLYTHGPLGGLFGQGKPVTYAGVTIYNPSTFNYWAGEFIGAQLWFWFLYRAYHDWELFVYGLPSKLDKELAEEGWDPDTSED